ncbi:MAG: polyprenyl synthetase family protein [Planctomycetes bacterium]|nr:polyprenyl synthetase family protein [Planctomycetota bacterium]
MDAFETYQQVWSPRIEEALDRALPREDEPPGILGRAMRYTVFAGGKRIRPVLVLLSAHAAGGTEEDAMAAACAVEMVHAFSLIHDDLPAMDDDDMRRGKPSNHRAFGEAVAILAGDGLLDHAFGVLADLPRREAVPEAVRILARAVGREGLVGGQVEDIEAEGRPPDLATVERIHGGKTAALIEACGLLGAVAAGAPASVVTRLGRYGRLLGLAFQIVDDVLDETGGDGRLGKKSGKDRARGKMTWPSVAGVPASLERARECRDLARRETAGLPGAEALGGLADLVVSRTH